MERDESRTVQQGSIVNDDWPQDILGGKVAIAPFIVVTGVRPVEGITAVKLPIYMTTEAACADICLLEDIMIHPQQGIKARTGLRFNLAKGTKIVMYPRSSLLMKYDLLEPVSIIDTDYKDEVHVPLFNVGKEVVTLTAGTRVAQIELQPVYPRPNDWAHEDAVRSGGFGSTGSAS